MTNLPFVSIIIPTLNEEKFIEKSLSSLLAQTYPADQTEILVSDGRSRDGTRGIVERIAREHPRVRLLDNPDRITPRALNIAVAEARGDVIVRIDAHCEYPAHYVEHCVKLLRETGADNVGGAWITLPGADTLIAHAIVFAQTSRFGLGGARYRVGGGQAGFVDTVPFGAFRREVFERVGLFDEELIRNQDNELNSRIIAAGGKIYFDPSLQLKYYSRPTLRKFLAMLRKNGLYHWLVLRKTPQAFRWRHMLPAFFLAFLALTAVGGWLWWPIWLVGVGGMALYGVANVLSSAVVAARGGWVYLFVMPWVFLLCHLNYGFATWRGLVTFGLLRRKGSAGTT